MLNRSHNNRSYRPDLTSVSGDLVGETFVGPAANAWASGSVVKTPAAVVTAPRVRRVVRRFLHSPG
jgi:hypothetical protein